MGSPLGPALANTFMCHYEGEWLDNCPLAFAPTVYARYVDDVFVLLRSRDYITCLAEYLSSRHPNIKFTFEIEENDCLPFLDVNIYRHSDKFSSSVYRKKTFSGVYTNYESFMPEEYKRGLISTLLYRAYMINSSYMSLHDEIEKLKKIFINNGYPVKFIDRCIRKFLDKMFEKRPPQPTVEEKKEVLFVMPFLGTTSYHVKKKLCEAFKDHLPSKYKLKVVFQTTYRMSSYFRFKDKFPSSLTSGVIYEYTCATCNDSYIGCTIRYFEKRLEEHTHISALTGKPLSGAQVFAPMQHVRSGCCNSNSHSTVPMVTRDNFKIIGYEKDRYLLFIKESILIKKANPKLNGTFTSVPLSLFA